MSLFLVLAILARGASAGEPKSVYTDTSHCKVLSRDAETGATRSLCGTVAGYTLLADDDDDRVSLTLKVDGHEQSLNFYEYVTDSFSSLGPKAEWRMRREGGVDVPYALIARIRWTSEYPKGKGEMLVVSKVSKKGSCIVQALDAKKFKSTNQMAREIADSITDQTACMAKPPR